MLNQTNANTLISQIATTSIAGCEQNTIITANPPITMVANTAERLSTSSIPYFPHVNEMSKLSFEEETFFVMPTSEMQLPRQSEVAAESPKLVTSSMVEYTEFTQVISDALGQLCPAEAAMPEAMQPTTGTYFTAQSAQNELETSAFAEMSCTEISSTSKPAVENAIEIRLHSTNEVLTSNAPISIFAPYNKDVPYRVPQHVNVIHTRPGVAYMGDSYLLNMEKNADSRIIKLKAKLLPVFTTDLPLPIFEVQENIPFKKDLKLRFNANLIRAFCENSTVSRATLLTRNGNLLMDYPSDLGVVECIPPSKYYLQGQIKLNMDLPGSFRRHIKKLCDLHMIVTVRYIDPKTKKAYFYDTHIRPTNQGNT